MKIGVRRNKIQWVLNDIIDDFSIHTRHDVVNVEDDPDVIWTARGGFRYSYDTKKERNYSCPIFLNLHHIVETKMHKYPFSFFNNSKVCIVPNKRTEELAQKYLNIPVCKMPYWILSHRMKPVDPQEVCAMKKEIAPNDEFIIGSFQKDSEGDTNKPKLDKGSDTFLNIVTTLSKFIKVKVVLAGFSRKYLIENFEKRNIPYVYFERYNNLNLLYDCLDWYLVTSRFEGGPQAVLETSYRKVKVLSTNVGVASEILHKDCICNNEDEFVKKIINGLDKTKENHEIIQSYLPKVVIPQWDDFFEDNK